MNFEYGDKLIFWAEWFQKEANLARSFYLFYFPSDNTVEIFDHRTKKLFLKRTKVEGLTASNFYVGAKLNIYGRQIDILDYADTPTKTKLASSRESTFCVLKPNAVRILDKILGHLNDFSINNCLMVQLTAEEALAFYEERKGDAVLPFLMDHLMSGPILGLELIAPGAVQKLIDITGPENPSVAKEQAPNSLRALYGGDIINNSIHCAESPEAAVRQLAFFFPPGKSAFRTTALMEGTTLGVVKPHAIKENKLGQICAAIYANGMRITAMKMSFLERPSCEEFYEVYRGIVPEYVSNVLELANGPCVAIEVQSTDPEANSYLQFRKLCGPTDVELAKQLRPNTIRARFGVSKVQNAIHCTDLEEDTRTEIEYFFKILD